MRPQPPLGPCPDAPSVRTASCCLVLLVAAVQSLSHVRLMPPYYLPNLMPRAKLGNLLEKEFWSSSARPADPSQS